MHSVSESLDTATPHGRFVLTLFGGLAQMERELIAERTRSVLAWKRENGLPTSHPPLGFRSIGKRERLEPVAEELEVVGEVLGLWRAGWGFRAIARSLNARGTPTKRRRRWHHSTIAKLVANRCRYYRPLGDTCVGPATPERACPPRSSGGLPVWQDGRLTGYPHPTPLVEMLPPRSANRCGATRCGTNPLPHRAPRFDSHLLPQQPPAGDPLPGDSGRPTSEGAQTVREAH